MPVQSRTRIGGYKLNVDDAGPDNEGRWGMAAVVRDSDEICCRCSLLVSTSTPRF
ncbi:hypothetical protein MtrunA17_Chr3g0109881 [Medicago truncatula]|uniref:Uncharacterized protein n=1 Tax=Medicago truncatula TaxID=3880 RepID=A0A396ITW1_MEDTR|nr:hypothetical protein MtrunA17_Chr3g0109881 [Medicago truncatula]